MPHLRAQVDAGAQAVQVFDSWVGALGPDDYERSVFPHMRRLFDGLADLGVPTIHFGVGTGELLALMRRAGGDVVGVDWRVPLDAAWERVGPDVGVQGNLDPAVLSAPWDVVEAETDRVLAARAGATGTSSTSGTACSRPPIPTRFDGWWTWCTSAPNDGRHRVSEAPIGVLVMAYGTASGPDDIERYYTDIRGGRTPTPEHLAELQDRYAAIGNVFPLLDTTRAQAEGLVERLNADAATDAFRAYLGMKHSAPFIPEAVAAMRADGIERGDRHRDGAALVGHVRRDLHRARDAGDRDDGGGPAFTFVRSVPRPPVVHRVPGRARRRGAATG